MTVNTCPCGQPANDGTICWACTHQLTANLRTIPDLLTELDITATRQARIGHRNGSRATDRPLPYHPHAVEVARNLRAVTLSWSALLAEELDMLSRFPDHPIGWLADNIHLARTKDWAPDCLTETRATTRAAWRTIDRPLERWFAGYCTTQLKATDGNQAVCGHALYGNPDQPTVRCKVCGTDYDITACRAWLTAAADEYLLPAGDIARALTRLQHPITSKLIWTWKERGKLEVRGRDVKGRETYRFGDVARLAKGMTPRKETAA